MTAVDWEAGLGGVKRLRYNVHFLDNEGNVYSSDIVEACTDQAAIEAARRIFKLDLGNGFEVRQGERLVSQVKSGLKSIPARVLSGVTETARRASDYETFAAECTRLAGMTNTLEVREQLMDLRDTYVAIAAQIQEGRRKDAGLLQGYVLYLRDAHGLIVARDHIEAENDKEAHAVAVVLLDACADVCSQFELWKGETMMSMGARPRHVPGPRDCNERVQKLVVERKVALRDNYQAIAASKRLLAKVAEWTANFEN